MKHKKNDTYKKKTKKKRKENNESLGVMIAKKHCIFTKRLLKSCDKMSPKKTTGKLLPFSVNTCVNINFLHARL